MKTSSPSLLQHEEVIRHSGNRRWKIWATITKAIGGWSRKINICLGQLYHLHERSYAPAHCQVITLKAGQVLQLSKAYSRTVLEVERGVVWLTSSPADGDILLKPGDQYRLSTHAPFVLQALTDSNIVARTIR